MPSLSLSNPCGSGCKTVKFLSAISLQSKSGGGGGIQPGSSAAVQSSQAGAACATGSGGCPFYFPPTSTSDSNGGSKIYKTENPTQQTTTSPSIGSNACTYATCPFSYGYTDEATKNSALEAQAYIGAMKTANYYHNQEKQDLDFFEFSNNMVVRSANTLRIMTAR
jgi:hypothetical protein